MQFLIPIGAALSLAGVAGLIWCIVQAVQARRAGLSDAGLRARLQRLVVVNLGALGVSALGLMLVVIGVLLG
ncbi:MAG: hypothetical protein Q8Q26_08360 [Pseudorhodobacter sp.]|nr:hypothetical protein [Pseudorhodobacter sp.]